MGGGAKGEKFSESLTRSPQEEGFKYSPAQQAQTQLITWITAFYSESFLPLLFYIHQ